MKDKEEREEDMDAGGGGGIRARRQKDLSRHLHSKRTEVCMDAAVAIELVVVDHVATDCGYYYGDRRRQGDS